MHRRFVAAHDAKKAAATDEWVCGNCGASAKRPDGQPPATDNSDRAFMLGQRITAVGLPITWLYSKHPKLNGITPKEALDGRET